MLILTQCLPANPDALVKFTLPLTAFERTRSRQRIEIDSAAALHLRLPRGTVLRDGDLLQSEAGDLIRIVAKSEPVLTVTTAQDGLLLRAAYHLGNRHVPLEITPTYLRLSPDPVLQAMLEQMGLEVKAETAPFQPELGAYGHSHP